VVLGRISKYSSAYYAPASTRWNGERYMLDLTASARGWKTGSACRARLRLGIAVAVHAIDFRTAASPAFRFAHPERAHRRAGEGARLTNSRNRHQRHQRVRTSRINSTVGVGRNVRAMRNWSELLRRVAGWMTRRHAVHSIFTHRGFLILFEVRAIRRTGWPGIFSPAASCPATTYLLHFAEDLRVVESWRVGGEHYQKTAEAWW